MGRGTSDQGIATVTTRRRVGHACALVAIAVWAVAALHPTPLDRAPASASTGSLSRFWRDWSLADGLRNVALTAPLGAALAVAGHGGPAIGAGAAGLACLVELAQLWVPGRHTSAGDVLLDALGALLGAAAWRRFVAARELSDTAAGRRAVAAGAVAAGLVVVAALAARPDLPPVAPSSAASPRIPWLSRASGRVLEARIGDLPLPPHQPVGDARDLERALREGGEVIVRWSVRDPAPGRVVPLLWVHRDGRFWLMGVDGRDLVWRWPPVGQRIGLEATTWRWRDALDGFAVGRTAELHFTLSGAGLVAGLADGGSFRRRFGPTETWRLIVPASHAVGDCAIALGSAAWIALVWWPLGLFARRNRATAVGVALAASALLAAPALGLAPAGPADWAGAALGLALGAGCARWSVRHIKV